MRFSPCLLAGFLWLCLLLLTACETPPDAQAIVDRAIEAHGGDRLDRAVVEFDLRGRHYKATRENGLFRYERIYTDSTGRTIHDVLTNEGLSREIDGAPVELTEEAYRSAETGVNSTIYFALLPYFLNDPAVQKTYLGRTTVQGEPYHQVGVTFREEGGGRDYQDRFVYWFHEADSTMDYLAYDFHVNGGGTRFRETYNPRRVGGVLFTDHNNYTSDTLSADALRRYGALLDEGGLERISQIILENVTVRPLD